MFAMLVVSLFSAGAVSAQITINIPKFPKIKKTKQEPSEQKLTTDNNQSNNNQAVENQPPAPQDKCAGNIWLNTHLEDIGKRQKEVDSFTPDRNWFTDHSNYDHLLYAVSPVAREKWLKSSNALDYKDCPNLVAAFDNLSASAAKKLPLYLPNTKVYGIRNPAEEKLMKTKISNLADHKIFYTGIQEANWLIDKNSLGIPKSRYKHGMVWVRYTPNDHSYCRVYYINIIQDYAGGGTYGASYGYFVEDKLSGCPANAK